MSVLKKIGSFGKKALKSIGNVSGKVLSSIGSVKNMMDSTGLTSLAQGALLSNPLTAPLGMGVSVINPLIKGSQSIMNSLAKI